MACSRQKGPAAYLSFIQSITEVHITQADWHDLRMAAKADGYNISRTRVTDSMTDKTAAALARSLGVTDSSKIDALKASLSGSNNTMATTSVMDYLTRFGVKESLAQVRSARKSDGSSTNKKVKSSESSRSQFLEPSSAQGILDEETFEAALKEAKLSSTEDLKKELDDATADMEKLRGVDNDAYIAAQGRLHAAYEELAQRGEVILNPGLHYMKLKDDPTVPEHQLDSFNYSFGAMKEIKASHAKRDAGDDNWAEEALANQDRRWENRVAVLESEGIDTSDSQGIADVEERFALEWANRKRLYY